MTALSGNQTIYATESISIEGEVKGEYGLEVIFLGLKGIKISVDLSLLENSSASVSMRGVSFANADLLAIGRIGKGSKGSSLSIEQAAFLAGGMVSFSPSIEIKGGQASASHKAYIYNIDQQALNYLMSRGLGKEKAELLLLLSFLKVNENHPFRSSIENAFANFRKKVE
ncbi:MAG: SufD family Fe-S cluster assembly protein [Candidatus Anstonellales archaeon]